jgi:hypothetical protein
MVASLGLASATTSTAVPSPQAWFVDAGQPDDVITDTVEIDGLLYAAGWFTEAGGDPAEGLATWDGSTWTAIDTGPGFEVESLATDGDNLFAGGVWYDFGPDDQSLGGVAVWDGTDWADWTANLPDGTDITALEYAQGELYAFGFYYLDPSNPGTRDCLALVMDGTAEAPHWASIGDVAAGDCMINAATLVDAPDDDIYIAGDFATIDGDTYNGVARYVTMEGRWEPLADGVNFGAGTGSPYDITQGPGGDADWSVVVAGSFLLDPIDGGDPFAFAMWDGSAWTPITGFDGDDYIAGTALATDNGSLYLGGYYATFDGETFNGIAKWDGTAADPMAGTFTPLGSGLTYEDGTYAEADLITPYAGSLLVSGDFEVAGDQATFGLARYGDAVVPGAPRAVKATAAATSAKVTWTAPLSDGGAAITSYRVTAAPGGRTCTATAPTRTCTVTGLTPGTAYRFTVKATNAVGTGPASAASAAVTIPRAASATYRTITARVLFYPGDSRVGPKGAATLAALKARIPAGAKVTWVKVTGYVQGTTSRYATNDAALALARAKSSALWLTRHGVGGAYTVGSGGVSGISGLDRAAVVAIRYAVPAA